MLASDWTNSTEIKSAKLLTLVGHCGPKIGHSDKVTRLILDSKIS